MQSNENEHFHWIGRVPRDFFCPVVSIRTESANFVIMFDGNWQVQAGVVLHSIQNSAQKTLSGNVHFVDIFSSNHNSFSLFFRCHLNHLMFNIASEQVYLHTLPIWIDCTSWIIIHTMFNEFRWFRSATILWQLRSSCWHNRLLLFEKRRNAIECLSPWYVGTAHRQWECSDAWNRKTVFDVYCLCGMCRQRFESDNRTDNGKQTKK